MQMKKKTAIGINCTVLPTREFNKIRVANVGNGEVILPYKTCDKLEIS